MSSNESAFDFALQLNHNEIATNHLFNNLLQKLKRGLRELKLFMYSAMQLVAILYYFTEMVLEISLPEQM